MPVPRRPMIAVPQVAYLLTLRFDEDVPDLELLKGAREVALCRDRAPPVLFRADARVVVRGRVLVAAAQQVGRREVHGVDLELYPEVEAAYVEAWDVFLPALRSRAGLHDMLDQVERAARAAANA